MELTDQHLETIREVARNVDHGKVIIHIAATANKLGVSYENNIRLEKEPTSHPGPMDRKEGKGYRT